MPIQQVPNYDALQAALKRLREELQQIEAAISGAGGNGNNNGSGGGASGAGGGGGGGSANGFPGFASGGGGFFSGGGGDFVSPTVGLKIKPDGSIEYDFEGHIKALGLDLPEASSFTKISEEIESLIAWQNEAGITKGFITSVLQETSRWMLLYSNSDRSSKLGIIELLAKGKAGTGAEDLSVRLESIGGGARAALTLTLGFITKTIYDEKEESHFLQLPARAKRIVTSGVISSAGAKVEGDSFTIKHPSTGIYEITLGEEAAKILNVQLTRDLGGGVIYSQARTKKGFTAILFNAGGTALQNGQFQFTSIG